MGPGSGWQPRVFPVCNRQEAKGQTFWQGPLGMGQECRLHLRYEGSRWTEYGRMRVSDTDPRWRHVVGFVESVSHKGGSQCMTTTCICKDVGQKG